MNIKVIVLQKGLTIIFKKFVWSIVTIDFMKSYKTNKNYRKVMPTKILLKLIIVRYNLRVNIIYERR